MFEAEAKIMFWLFVGPFLLGLLATLIAPQFIRGYAQVRVSTTAGRQAPTATPGPN